MKKLATAITAAGLLALSGQAISAEQYVIDTEGQHAFIQFKIKHLGYSWVIGTFEDFSGEFSYDTEDPSNSEIMVKIDPASVDTNHAERDKHIRSDDFFNVAEYPNASFKSTSYSENEDGSGTLKGDLTFHGVTKPVTIDTQMMGAGKDPWGGYRRGFEGSTTLTLSDFGIDAVAKLGEASATAELFLTIEGKRQ